MSTRVLVAGIGNIFRRDDGFGSEVARRLSQVELAPDVRVVDYGIRGMHLAYDLLDGYDALLLVDTVPVNGRPGSLRVLEVGPDDLVEGELDAHGMEPTAVLSNLEVLGGRLPRTIVVGCEASDVGDGIGLSETVTDAVDDAVRTVVDLVDELRRS